MVINNDTVSSEWSGDVMDKFENLKLIRNEVIYSDSIGELRGWEQPNNAIILFAGDSKTENAEDYLQTLQFPKGAIPALIAFLKAVELPCAEGRRLFKISWDAPAEKHGILYADYLEHIATCKECEIGLHLSDMDIQDLKCDAEGYRRGAKIVK